MASSGAWQRFWRSCRRHPKVSGVTGGVLALIVVIGAVGSTGEGGTKDTAGSGSPPTSASQSTPAGAGGEGPITSDSAAKAAAANTSPATPTHSTARPPKMTQAAVDKTQATSRTALSVLATLAVKGRAPKTGYSRAQFGTAWTDANGDPDGHNGCRTRDDILARDLAQVRTADGCKVLTGVLHDPYTATTIKFVYGEGTSSAVQIDHVVALSNAWQTGSQYWNLAKRIDLANDPLNLLAVDGPTNEAKGDGDAATWLPPNKAYRCAYVARQVAVKARYGLWVTHAEHDAIARVLSSCPGQTAPGESGSPNSGQQSSTPASSTRHTTSTPKPPPTTSTAPKPKPPASTSSGPKIVEYQNCTAMHKDYPHGVGRSGARDHTSGTPVTNFYVSTALYNANTKSDRDKDGIACEER